MRAVLLGFLLAATLQAATTVTFNQLYHGSTDYPKSFAVGGTGTVSVSGCTNITVGDLICGNGGFGFHLASPTAPTTLYTWFHADNANFVAVGTHQLSMVVSSTGFSDTLIMSLVVSARTDPIVTSPAGTFTGCTSINPALYPGEQENCITNQGYPGHGAFTIPAVGSSYTDYNFGGVVTMLQPISARRVVANDATTSAYNLDATLLMTTPVAGGVFATDTTTGLDTWNLGTIPGYSPQSLNWSQTAANKLYFFNFADSTLRSQTLSGTPPTGFPAASAPLYQYRSGNQTFSAGISNGGEGVPTQGDWIGWATQGGAGTDHVFGITHAAAANPTLETYTTDFSGIAVHTQVYTITAMSGNGVTPVHVTFSPALVASSFQAVTQVTFDSGAAGNTAMNGLHCAMSGYVNGGATGSMDCLSVTGNGTWTAGGTFKETCIIAGFPFPPCSRGVTMGKVAEVGTGKLYMVASIDIGSGNDLVEIYSFRPGVDSALVDEGHAAQFATSAERVVPTYNGPHCDDTAWKAGNCLNSGHMDTIAVAGHNYLTFNVQATQPYDVGFMALASPDLMLTSAELGGGYSHVGILQSTGCAGFCGFHIGAAATSPVAVYSTDEDPDQVTYAVTGATNATPIHITSSPAYPGANGDVLRIGGLLGNTALNNGSCTVANLSGASFDCSGSVGNGVWTSGGKFIKDVVPGPSSHQGEIILIDATNIAAHQFTLKRLAKSRSWGIVSDATASVYYSQPHAVISPDGTRVAWESNFGYPEQFGVAAMPTGFVPVPPIVNWLGGLFGGGIFGLGVVR